MWYKELSGSGGLIPIKGISRQMIKYIYSLKCAGANNKAEKGE